MTYRNTESSRLSEADWIENKAVSDLIECALPLFLWRYNELRTDDSRLT
jgi:hypothetical protein